MTHPSNTLYNGECYNIEQAFDLVVAELNYEARLDPRSNGTDEFEQQLVSRLKDDVQEVQQLRSEYYARINAVRNELMADWKKRGGWAPTFAQCYEDDDYAALAI